MLQTRLSADRCHLAVRTPTVTWHGHLSTRLRVASTMTSGYRDQCLVNELPRCFHHARQVDRQPHRLVVAAAQAGATAGGGGAGGGGSSGGGGGSSGSGDAGKGGNTPHPMQLWTWGYAAFLAVGGVFAFVKAGSKKSLTSALGAALILALSARKMVVGSAAGSIAVCLAISVFLSIIMSGRYSRTRKVMPAGMTAAASLGMSAAYIMSLVA